MGAKRLLPDALAPLARGVASAVERLPVPLPVLVPALPMQFVHEDDVGRALLLCVVGAGPADTYNIAGDGTLTARDVAAEAGLAPVPLPLSFARRLTSAMAAVPIPSFLPPAAAWIQAASHPVIVDTTKAKRDLGWRPEFSGLQALRATLHRR